MSGTLADPIGITNPPIDELLMIDPPPCVAMWRAARWLRGRAPGLYTIEQVLGL